MDSPGARHGLAAPAVNLSAGAPFQGHGDGPPAARSADWPRRAYGNTGGRAERSGEAERRRHPMPLAARRRGHPRRPAATRLLLTLVTYRPAAWTRCAPRRWEGLASRQVGGCCEPRRRRAGG